MVRVFSLILSLCLHWACALFYAGKCLYQAALPRLVLLDIGHHKVWGHRRTVAVPPRASRPAKRFLLA